MADPTQSTPVDNGVQWDAPATVQTGSSTPAPQASAPAAAPVSSNGITWDDEQPTSPATPADDQGLLHGLYEHTVAPLADGASVLKQIYNEPTWEGQRAVLNKALAGVVQPNVDLAKRGAGEIADAYRSRNTASTDDRGAGYIEGLTHLGEAAVPFMGPQTAASQDAINKGKTSEGIGNTMGDIITMAAPDVAGGVKDRFTGPKDLQNTPAHRGFTAVLDQGKAGMGKNFDAQEVANDIAPVVQQELRSNPALRERILDPKATPKESYEAFQEAIQNAQGHIDEAHLEALKNVKNQPVDVKPVLDEIDKLKTEGMNKYAPEDAEELDALKQRIGSVETLGELNGLRMYLNNQTSPAFKMSGVAVQRSAMLDKAMGAAGSATRDAYYDGLSNATGQDFQKLKQTESNLLSARESLENAKGPLVSKEIQFNRPSTVKQKVGAVADAATSVVKGDKKKIASAVLNESPMAQTHADIRRFTRELPTSGLASYDGVQPPNRPQLPNRTTPETVNAQTTPNPRPSGPPAEVGSSAAPARLQTGTSGLPAGEPNAPGLPQGPARPQGLPSTASNSRVGVPGKPYPSLNTSTAVDRTARPIYTKPGVIPDRSINVTPQGDAVIKREALPAPATKPKKSRTNS